MQPPRGSVFLTHNELEYPWVLSTSGILDFKKLFAKRSPRCSWKYCTESPRGPPVEFEHIHVFGSSYLQFNFVNLKECCGGSVIGGRGDRSFGITESVFISIFWAQLYNSGQATKSLLVKPKPLHLFNNFFLVE